MFEFSKRYILNKDSLSYEEAPPYFKSNTIAFIAIVLLFIMVLVASTSMVMSFFNTPKEKVLINENKILVTRYKSITEKLDSLSTRLDSLNYKDDSVYRIVFGASMVPASVRTAGFGGYSESDKQNNNLSNSVVYETQLRIKQFENKLIVSEKSYEKVLQLAKTNMHKMQHIPAIMPVSNINLKRTGSGFGRRFHPLLNIWRMHEGIDFIGEYATPIYATANGVVKKRYLSKTFGNVLVIDHGYGYETYYAHLSKYKVNLGAKVKRGEQIGLMGSTGLSSGTHLHYEVHLNGKEIDPVNYFYNDLSPEQYEEIKRIAAEYNNSMD